MAKSKMNLKYKKQKRERNKKVEVDSKKELKSNIIAAVSVVAFIALVYLGALGLEKLGVFEAGYTKPTINSELNYTRILIGETFNRPAKEYLVLFDTFGDKNNDMYVQLLTESKKDLPVYYVDMSEKSNEKFVSDSSNTKAKNVNELKINGITLIRIKNEKIAQYITGSDSIAEYLKK